MTPLEKIHDWASCTDPDEFINHVLADSESLSPITKQCSKLSQDLFAQEHMKPITSFKII
jgi:hypothetical protein